MRRVSQVLAGLMVLAVPALLRAGTISVGQFSIEYPSVETVGYYGFTVSNLTGNSTAGACTAGYPVCTPLVFQNATLSVQYGYGQIQDNGSGVGVVVGSLMGQGTYTVTAQDSDPFNPSYNSCGVYGVDSSCAGLDDVANAFQLPLPVADGLGNNLVILSATFSASSAPTSTNSGTLAGPYTATLLPTLDCAGPCNFLDTAPGLFPNPNTGIDPNSGYWEYFDATADIVTQAPPPTGGTVPEPGTIWLVAPLLGVLGWAWREKERGRGRSASRV